MENGGIPPTSPALRPSTKRLRETYGLVEGFRQEIAGRRRCPNSRIPGRSAAQIRDLLRKGAASQPFPGESRGPGSRPGTRVCRKNNVNSGPDRAGRDAWANWLPSARSGQTRKASDCRVRCRSRTVFLAVRCSAALQAFAAGQIPSKFASPAASTGRAKRPPSETLAYSTAS